LPLPARRVKRESMPSQTSRTGIVQHIPDNSDGLGFDVQVTRPDPKTNAQAFADVLKRV